MPFPRPTIAFRSPSRRPPRGGDPVSTRTMSLCPPLFPETTWGDRLRGTVERLVGPWRTPPATRLGEPTRPSADPPPADDALGRRAMRMLQAEFTAVLADVDDPDADALRSRVSLALGERELWNLRPAMFGLLALSRGEAEAQRRVARLDRHFPRRVAGAPIAGWGRRA